MRIADNHPETTSKAWKSKAFRPKVSWRETEGEGIDRRQSLAEIGEAQERRRSSLAHPSEKVETYSAPTEKANGF